MARAMLEALGDAWLRLVIVRILTLAIGIVVFLAFMYWLGARP